jgi:hypothetical protein
MKKAIEPAFVTGWVIVVESGTFVSFLYQQGSNADAFVALS